MGKIMTYLGKMERLIQIIKYICKNLKVSQLLLSVRFYIRILVIEILDQKQLSLQKST